MIIATLDSIQTTLFLSLPAKVDPNNIVSTNVSQN
jgi:hypothetical protein